MRITGKGGGNIPAAAGLLRIYSADNMHSIDKNRRFPLPMSTIL
ncbi:hypothetical protein ETAE_3179 [Edwardsiella piscicida]|uniref:Uncharacterized protein n=1 Tax=Edwardsiella piscicida TaxID=1263550 RepID=A0AAU8PTK9_EDWPI|nr:hypothetical protein ETAE_3179 [Edwardsiella tarda EIB202]